jgi:pectate lyase
MKQVLLLLLTFAFVHGLKAQQIDESFASAPEGWEWNSTTTVSGGALQISKQSEGGYAISPPVTDPLSITIVTNNSGNTNRSIQLYYGEEDNWVLFYTHTVANKIETIQVDEENVNEITGTVRIKIVNTGSNPFVVDHFTVGGEGIPSSDAEITGFSVEGQIGTALINSGSATVAVVMPTGSDVSTVVPLISLSPRAGISPERGNAVNLSSPFEYTVTAEDGTIKVWTVSVQYQDSDEKDITSFVLSAHQIGSTFIDAASGLIRVNMPQGANLNGIVPVQITASVGATISPLAGVARDFSSDALYEVTAQNGSKRNWTIRVNLVDPAFSNFDFSVPVGFAAVSGDGFTGPTTGGGDVIGATNVLVVNGNNDFEELVRHLYDRGRAYKNKADNGRAKYAPLVVIMEEGIYTGTGTLSGAGSTWSPGTGMFAIEEQGDLTIIGRGNVVLNFGFNVKRSWNIIFRNLTFQDYYDDGINIGGSETHHVWVDHCTFGHPTTMPVNKDHPDGGVDIKDGASYVTVSWCKFRNSWKTGLVGHSDSNESTDTGRLKTTFYMNHYVNTNSRHPRVRFGEVHVLNNFYEGVLNYGVAAAFKALVHVEGNFFLNTVWPMYADRSSSDFTAVYGPWTSETGNKAALGLSQVNNKYDDSGLTKVYTSTNINVNMLNPGGKSIKFDELNPEVVFNPLTYYTYVSADAELVPDLVRAFAGANAVDFFSGSATSVFTPEVSRPELLVFPNPASGAFSIKASEVGELTISDLSGNIVMRRMTDAGVVSVSTSEVNLYRGIYLVTLKSRNGTKTIKLVVQ